MEEEKKWYCQEYADELGMSIKKYCWDCPWWKTCSYRRQALRKRK